MTITDYQSIVKKLKFEGRAYINGKFQGTTPATTPIGSFTTKLVIEGSVTLKKNG